MLKLDAVSRAVRGRLLVREVSLSLAAGEVLAILGPSGSGKTSLLRLIAGFDAPTAGSVQIASKTVSTAGRVLAPPEQRAVAVAFQDATLFPHLDPVHNVAFAIRSGDKAARLHAARTALAEMGLTDMDGREVATLSGGEAQRVALARALAAGPRLLLLDEPFGNVDRLTRADLVQRLRVRLPACLGAIVITHDPADAVELGARVVLMRDGQVVADGAHTDVAAGAHGAWAQSFLRSGH